MSAQAVYAKINTQHYLVTDPDTLGQLENHKELVKSALKYRCIASHTWAGAFYGWISSAAAIIGCGLPPCPFALLPATCCLLTYATSGESNDKRIQANLLALHCIQTIAQNSQRVETLQPNSRVIEIVRVCDLVEELSQTTNPQLPDDLSQTSLYALQNRV
jgi:hypothetical protein